MFGHRESQAVIDAIIDLAESCAKDPWDVPAPPENEAAVATRLGEIAEASIRDAYIITVKQERVEAVSKAKSAALTVLAEEQGDDFDEQLAAGALKNLEKDVVRSSILQTGVRIDGRDTSSVRPIVAEVGVLDRAHGSALFTRGETQALVVTTLGTGQDEQIIDALEGEYREHFMLHYNFPPYSVGEASFLRSPGRREIGHGKLAWRAIRPLLPHKDDFPYTIRVVSEITESNGSSSMATVCGTSMSLMDSGVPMVRACAGIAMGLIKEGDEVAVLSDILGDEDHFGDMDFKIAGTQNGITGIQLDLKIEGISEEIIRATLAQSREARMEILRSMLTTIPKPKEDISGWAPRLLRTKINPEKIGMLIGPGGKNIRSLQETTGTVVEVDDDGVVTLASNNAEDGNEALAARALLSLGLRGGCCRASRGCG